MYCNKCGHSIDNFSLYCGHCGAKNRFAAATIYAKEFKNGNRDSFSDLYNESYPTVLNAIEGKFDNNQDIEDCIQRVYLKVYDKIDQYDEKRPFLTWIYTVAKNTAIDELRKQGKKQDYKEIPISYTEDEEEKEIDLVSCYEEFNPTATIDESEKDDIINSIMRSLPESSKECILLMYTEGLKIKDIASMLEVDEGTVKSRLSYGRKLVKEKVLEYQSNGLKLYSMSPFVFFIWLLKASKAEASGEYAALGSKICNDILSSANTVNIAGSVAEKVTEASTNEVVKEVTKKVVIEKAAKLVISKKLVAIIAAIAVVGGAGAGVGLAVVTSNKPDKENVEQVADNGTGQESEEDTVAYDDKLDEKYAPVLDAYNDYIENGNVDNKYVNLEPNKGMYGTTFTDNLKDNLQYVYYDINDDGNEELLVSMTPDDEPDQPPYYLLAVYSYDDTGIIKIDSPYSGKYNKSVEFIISGQGYIECYVDGEGKELMYSLSEDGADMTFEGGIIRLSDVFYYFDDENDVNKSNGDFTESEISQIRNNPDEALYEKISNMGKYTLKEFFWTPFTNDRENILNGIDRYLFYRSNSGDRVIQITLYSDLSYESFTVIPDLGTSTEDYGNFSISEQIDEYTYVLKIENYTNENDAHMGNTDTEYLLYLPGKSIDEISAEFPIIWTLDVNYDEGYANTHKVLDKYMLLNTTNNIPAIGM